MNNSSQKILVTGAAGFLGSHLAEQLSKKGHQVIGVDNMKGGYKDNIPNSIKFFKLDCCSLYNSRSRPGASYLTAPRPWRPLLVGSDWEINQQIKYTK